MTDRAEVRLAILDALHDFVSDAEALLLLAHALEDGAPTLVSRAHPQEVGEVAGLVERAARKLTLLSSRGTTCMNHAEPLAQALIGTALHQLASDAEALLLIASALAHRATGIESNPEPQKVRDLAALVKSAALQLTLAAANLVGTAERVRRVADFCAAHFCTGAQRT